MFKVGDRVRFFDIDGLSALGTVVDVDNGLAVSVEKVFEGECVIGRHWLIDPHEVGRVCKVSEHAPFPVSEHAARKARPMARGLLAYFPDALSDISSFLIENPDPDTLQEDTMIEALVDGEYIPLALHLLHELQAHLTKKCVPQIGGLFARFGDALAEVARVSLAGNEQHHPGGALYWEFARSTDHDDCLIRHYKDHCQGTHVDTDGQLHLAKALWRALAGEQTYQESVCPELHARRQAQRDKAAKGGR